MALYFGKISSPHRENFHFSWKKVPNQIPCVSGNLNVDPDAPASNSEGTPQIGKKHITLKRTRSAPIYLSLTFPTVLSAKMHVCERPFSFSEILHVFILGQLHPVFSFRTNTAQVVSLAYPGSLPDIGKLRQRQCPPGRARWGNAASLGWRGECQPR